MDKKAVRNYLIPLLILVSACEGTIPPLSFATHGSLEISKEVIALLKKNEPTVITDELYYRSIIERIPVDPFVSTLTIDRQIFSEIYARPIEVTEDRKYVSRILSQFAYDPNQRKLTLTLRPDVYYSDGSKMSINDIALMLTRGLRKRPFLEPFDRIKGAKSWISNRTPLNNWPSGIDVDEQKGQLTVSFDRAVQDAYYWLAFSMSSVLPRACIDPKTAELKCDRPPLSGLYGIENFQNGVITFKRRVWDQKLNIVDRFHLVLCKNRNVAPYLDYLGDKHVIDAARGFHFLGGLETTVKRNFKTTGFTENGIDCLLLNPKSKTFKEKRVRQFFASEIRKTLINLGRNASGSIIPILSPGYLGLKTLEEGIPAFSKEEASSIIAHLRKYPPILENVFAGQSSEQFSCVFFEQTVRRLNIPFKQAFQGNFGFGFLLLESIDPIHGLKFVLNSNVRYAERLTDRIKSLLMQLSSNHQENQEFNRELFDDSAVAVLLHFGRFQILTKSTSLSFKEQFLRAEWHRFFEKKVKSDDS